MGKLDKILVLVLVGVTGSGKSTFVKLLVEKHNKFTRISSGDVVRKMHADLTDAEREDDKAFIDKYGLSKYDNQVRAGVYVEIDKAVAKGVVPVLDGYPRTVAQMADLINRFNVVLVKLNVNAVMAMGRLNARNRDDGDNEAILMAQFKLMAPMLDYVKDYSESMTGDKIPVLVLDNDGSSKEGIAHGVETIFHYYQFCKENHTQGL